MHGQWPASFARVKRRSRCGFRRRAKLAEQVSYWGVGDEKTGADVADRKGGFEPFEGAVDPDDPRNDLDPGSAEPPATSPAAPGVTIPLFITNPMAHALRVLGYSGEAIDQLTPEQAQAILAAREPATSQNMAASVEGGSLHSEACDCRVCAPPEMTPWPVS
jgi:hypothetical protein